MLKSRIITVFQIIAAAFVLLSVVSCSRGGGSTGSSNILTGKTVTIGHWWTPYDVNTAAPSDEVGELSLEWRTRIQKENDFTIKEAQVADWGGMLETVTTSIMAGNPVADIFILQPDWAMTLYKRGLLFPVSDSKAVDLTTTTAVPYRQVAWNQQIRDAFTFDGKTYAFTNDIGGNVGVYFNKRLFMEAGIDPDLPYDMQRDGTWTWNNFLELSRRLTRDRNNTGLVDTWAMPSDFTVEILEQFLFSNGANYVAKDSSGRFVNATGKPEFLEAMQYARMMLEEGLLMPKPEEANWDWFLPYFIDGRTAMLMSAEYRRGDLQSMADDWGYVVPPIGPRQQAYRIPISSNVMIIPASQKPEDVDAVLTAVNLWYTPVTDDWKAGLWNMYRDTHVVNETMAFMRDPALRAFRYYVLVPNLNLGEIAWQLWSYEGDAAQLVESVARNWNAQIDMLN